MSALLHDPDGLYRKCYSLLLQRLAKMPLADIAQAIGKSESTACRIRDGEQALAIGEWCALMAAAGLRVVDRADHIVDASIYDATCAIVAKAMAHPEIAKLLLGAGK